MSNPVVNNPSGSGPDTRFSLTVAGHSRGTAQAVEVKPPEGVVHPSASDSLAISEAAGRTVSVPVETAAPPESASVATAPPRTSVPIVARASAAPPTLLAESVLPQEDQLAQLDPHQRLQVRAAELDTAIHTAPSVFKPLWDTMAPMAEAKEKELIAHGQTVDRYKITADLSATFLPGLTAMLAQHPLSADAPAEQHALVASLKTPEGQQELGKVIDAAKNYQNAYRDLNPVQVNGTPNVNPPPPQQALENLNAMVLAARAGDKKKFDSLFHADSAKTPTGTWLRDDVFYKAAASGKDFQLVRSSETDASGKHSYNLVVDGETVPLHFYEDGGTLKPGMCPGLMAAEKRKDEFVAGVRAKADELKRVQGDLAAASDATFEHFHAQATPDVKAMLSPRVLALEDEYRARGETPPHRPRLIATAIAGMSDETLLSPEIGAHARRWLALMDREDELRPQVGTPPPAISG